jgi:opacity protein-like surface antigen
MKKQISLAAAVMALCITPLSVVHAAGVDGMDLDLHPYVGAGIGAFGLEYKDSLGSQNNTVFGGYGKIGVDIGYYLGAEVRIGTTTSGTTAQPAGAFSLTTAADNKLSNDFFVSYLGKVQIPVTAELTPYALIGATTAKFTDTPTGKTAFSQTVTGLSYGFGLDYNVGNQLSINGEWMQYLTNVNLSNFVTSTGATTGSGKAKMWGAVGALNYHF